MMQRNAVLIFVLALSHASARGLQADGERPVAKIVRLLQDMKTQLETEKADDQAVFESLDCWCKTNGDEKSAAIASGESKISDLKASMGEFAAKIEELRTGLADAKAKLRADQTALATATAMRMKEVKSFQGEETDLLASVQSCKQAVVVLSKHNPSFTQLSIAAKNLEGVKTMELAKNALGADKLAVLKAFVQEAQESSSLRRIPGFKSYTPQSSQIFGVLKTMQEEFEASLSDAQKSEAKAVEDFAALKIAKVAELGAGKKQQAQLEQDDAAFREKNAQAYEEFNDTQDQLEIDQTFLRNLQKKCSQSDATFDKRMKDRTEEIQAVEETIALLNSDDSFDNFEKTVKSSLVQVSVRRSHSQETSIRKRAAAVLRSVQGNQQMAMLAATVELDGFEKAIAAIDKMVTDLTNQQKEEVEHKDWCQTEMQDNSQETESKYDKKSNLETSISDLTKTIKTLSTEIKANEKAIAEMQTQMKRSSEIREGENSDFQQTVTDQRITQTILKKAIDRMAVVFSDTIMFQKPGAPHVQTSGTHTDPGNGPAKFKKYEQNAGGDKVMAMLEEVMADSKKMENEAIQGEQDAQGAYEMFMKDSNKSIKQSLKSNVNMSEEKAKAEEALSMDETDLAATMKTLESLNAKLGDLHKSCDFVMNNFSARQEARALEMDALREAKNILGGMK